MGRTQGRDPAADAPLPDDSDMPFETALERLESVVDRLEQGDLSLEAALSSFEQGVGLAKRCAGELDAAERRIEVLTREGGKWLARPLDSVEDFASDEDEEV